MLQVIAIGENVRDRATKKKGVVAGHVGIGRFASPAVLVEWEDGKETWVDPQELLFDNVVSTEAKQ